MVPHRQPDICTHQQAILRHSKETASLEMNAQTFKFGQSRLCDNNHKSGQPNPSFCSEVSWDNYGWTSHVVSVHSLNHWWLRIRLGQFSRSFWSEWRWRAGFQQIVARFVASGREPRFSVFEFEKTPAALKRSPCTSPRKSTLRCTTWPRETLWKPVVLLWNDTSISFNEILFKMHSTTFSLENWPKASRKVHARPVNLSLTVWNIEKHKDLAEYLNYLRCVIE